jgi:hypothetical protein
MCESLISEEVRSETHAFGGKFLPRGVWEKKGWDMSTIIPRLSATDKESDPVLGDVYRIPIKSKIQAAVRSLTRKTGANTMSVQQQQPKRGRLALTNNMSDGETEGEGNAEALLAIEDGRTSSSRSSSTSSSSSSSSGKKKKSKKSKKKSKKSRKSKKSKKSKKDKREESAAEKKAREALERAQQRESDKHCLAAVRNAEAVIKKSTSIISAIKPLTSNPSFGDVAPVIAGPVTTALEKFEGYVQLAEATIAAGGKNSSVGDVPVVADLAAEMASTRKSANLLTAMLATMAKARRM